MSGLYWLTDEQDGASVASMILVSWPTVLHSMESGNVLLTYQLTQGSTEAWGPRKEIVVAPWGAVWPGG